MPMMSNGLAKLVEELGELSQVAGKMLQYPSTDDHPDGQGSLRERMEKEMGDVVGAIRFVVEKLELDQEYICDRSEEKLKTFREWDGEPDISSPD